MWATYLCSLHSLWMQFITNYVKQKGFKVSYQPFFRPQNMSKVSGPKYKVAWAIQNEHQYCHQLLRLFDWLSDVVRVSCLFLPVNIMKTFKKNPENWLVKMLKFTTNFGVLHTMYQNWRFILLSHRLYISILPFFLSLTFSCMFWFGLFISWIWTSLRFSFCFHFGEYISQNDLFISLNGLINVQISVEGEKTIFCYS